MVSHAKGNKVRPPDQQGVSRRSRRAIHAAVLIVLLILGAWMMATAVGLTAHAWLGWVALLPLFFVIRLWRPLTAMMGGAIWGVSLFAFSLSQPTQLITPTIQSALLLCATPALYAFIGAWLTRWIGFNPFVLGFTWMGVELALGPVGLRGGLLGAAPANTTAIQWIGGALGYVLVAFLVAFVNAALVSALSTLRLTIPGQRYIARSRDGEKHLLPQTSFCLPISAVGPVQPRAPPIQLAIP